jgi:hypothetical protein
MALVGNEQVLLQGTDGTGRLSSVPEAITSDLVAGTNNRVLTSAFSQASSTALNNVSGFSVNLVAGGVYSVYGWLHGSAAASGGLKAALAAVSGLTLTSMTLTCWGYNATTINGVNTVTALGSDFVNSAAAYTDIFFQGRITVNAAGTIQLQAAQNTSSATATTITDGTLELTRCA